MSDVFRMWVYHESEEPKIIDSDKFEEMKEQGWSDTPATFIKFEDFGIDKEKLEEGDFSEALKVEQLDKAFDGVCHAMNGALNFELMSKNELEEYALKHFKTDLDKRRSKANLIKQIKELEDTQESLIDGDSE